MKNFSLICCVVNVEQGSRALKIAKRHGVRGGTICMGRGTISNKILELLDLNDSRKEFVMMCVEKELTHEVIDSIATEMHFSKPNHGIAFSCPITHFLGFKHYEYGKDDNKEMEAVYNAIFTVVDKGLAEDVVTAGKAAGARGGTIINARGSGIHDASVVFAMAIEPEKEMVMILAQKDLTGKIVTSIRDKMRIDEPNKGIIFTVPVNEAIGLQ
ncbi:MAG: P-II family nitrogen regulator [Clostridiales bacterium]|nr:P-II family nitrogen regulator [Clostridiales bacterium]